MGSRGYQTGLAAEEIAERHYEAAGAVILARRWKCPAGEIDLIVSFPGLVVFAEVKARKTLDAAAYSILPRQMERIGAAASLWLAKNSDGNSDCRFDAVLVDAVGKCYLVENAFSFDGW